MLPVFNLNDVTPSHVQGLIDSDVAENQTLEYKSELPTNQSERKREFLYDIAAMTNGGGGDFVFGIADRKGEDDQSTGIADRIAGLASANLQSEIDRLSNLIRDSISPRLTGVAMAQVSCPQGQVLILRVPRSWSSPHMVTIDGVNKFYKRAGTQKYLMSVDEIRRAFSEQGEIARSVRQWRSLRADVIPRNGGPTPLPNEVTLLFHVIPASAFTTDDVLRESWRFPEAEKLRVYVPHGITNSRYNADGFLATSQAGNQVYGYTQVFRSGIIEYADGQCSGRVPGGETPQIIGQEIEKQIVRCYRDAVDRFRAQGRTDTLYVGFSISGTSNQLIFSTLMQSLVNKAPIRESMFISPEVLVDITDVEEIPYPKALLPLVDAMWQLAGREGSPFKTGGVWDPFKEYR